MRKKDVKEGIRILTNPFLDPQEAQESLFLEGEKLSMLISDKDFQKQVKDTAEQNILGLWGAVLRALLNKSIEGDTQAMKLLFDYVEQQKLLCPISHSGISPGSFTEEERQRLAFLIKGLIKKKENPCNETPSGVVATNPKL